MYKVGIAGVGFVGGAMKKSFFKKNIECYAYDKFKEDKDLVSIDKLLQTDFVFLCLPTLFKEGSGYDKSAILEVCNYLNTNNYNGLVVIKSTIEPGTTMDLSSKYDRLKICHNPEFLTERTSFEDFHNQKHIVIGFDLSSDLILELVDFYFRYYSKNISICSSLESESMKLFCNNFYAMKVGIANEFYKMCMIQGIDYNNVKGLMIKNGWIMDMHLNVPGPDGLLGWGGNCFIKDTEALELHMKNIGSDCDILSAAIKENKRIRNKSNE
jgi:UDPglucose 6-dehydrogenase